MSDSDRQRGLSALTLTPGPEQVPFTCVLVDVCVCGEDLVKVIESALVNGGGVVHQKLLDFQAVGDFGQAQHASIEHRDQTGFGKD